MNKITRREFEKLEREWNEIFLGLFMGYMEDLKNYDKDDTVSKNECYARFVKNKEKARKQFMIK